ncbi:hypothetical protein HDF24_15645 [Mucilaginibacter sp. X4EP1]|uniref:hypothetical protein n=1 Tax=Mucilaginibacter sp. X4EP1 TaxID=2723092 RepID=UPI002167DD88|nr:hypothetical protein [Mucilaginibacter sp. X4EP1]MCS3814792.1 hypothetical protein [Mucilaginibacter sp. X4EP1]
METFLDFKVSIEKNNPSQNYFFNLIILVCDNAIIKGVLRQRVHFKAFVLKPPKTSAYLLPLRKLRT